MRLIIRLVISLALIVPAITLRAEEAGEVVIASKSFNENVLLAEVLTARLRAEGVDARHQADLGGSRILWQALKRGDVDAYVDYSGTLALEILAASKPLTRAGLADRLTREGVSVIGRLGFENAYGIGLSAAVAKRTGATKISDLTRYPDLALGFSHEFLDRPDGWPGLVRHYALPQKPSGLQHVLAYRGIAAGQLDGLDIYTTDAEIAEYGLVVLQDDRDFFPDYHAVIIARDDLQRRHPGAVAALRSLVGKIDTERMIALNAAMKVDGQSPQRLAAQVLAADFGIAPSGDQNTGLIDLSGPWGDVPRHTARHSVLVLTSLLAALIIAVPLGVASARNPRLGAGVMTVVSVVQTIPSLALFVFLIPLFGIGGLPAMLALFLYSLLPIIRNTHAGLTGIAPDLLASADALGLPPRARLRLIELPMALPVIMAGIKTAAVINIGTATLGALIGAGGYGEPILTGIRLSDTAYIMSGAVPAAAMALLAQALISWLGRAVTPAPLRQG